MVEFKKNQSEKAKLKPDGYWQSVIENAGLAICTIGKDGAILSVNNQFTLTNSVESIGKTFHSLITPDYRDVFNSSFNEVLKTGRPSFCTLLLNFFSSPTLFDCYLGAIKEQGKISAVSIVLNDITEHSKQSNEDHKISESQYKQIVDNLPIGICELDLVKQRFVTVNETMCELSGFTMEEFMKINPLDHLTPHSREKYVQRIEIESFELQP